MRHRSARAVGAKIKSPASRGMRVGSVWSASSRKIACWPKPHRDRRGHPTLFVFSILVDCSARNLRSRRASRQPQTSEVRSEQRKNLWISLNPFGTRPEHPIPPIPPPAEPSNPPERLSIGVTHRTLGCTRTDRCPEPARVMAAGAAACSESDGRGSQNSNETRGGIDRRRPIPPSACLPVLALCFADPAPASGAPREWSSR